jgi:hypothetical protein
VLGVSGLRRAAFASRTIVSANQVIAAVHFTCKPRWPGGAPQPFHSLVVGRIFDGNQLVTHQRRRRGARPGMILIALAGLRASLPDGRPSWCQRVPLVLQVSISSAPQLAAPQSHKPGAPLRSLPHSHDFILAAVIIILATGFLPAPDRLARPYGRPAAMVLQSGRNGGFILAQDNLRPESCDSTRYIGIGIPVEWRLIANL